MNLKEEERRARLLKSRAERLPGIKKQFEESQGRKFDESQFAAIDEFEAAQSRNFNSNFAPGGKDASLVGNKPGSGPKAGKTTKKGSSSKNTAKKTIKKATSPAKSQAKLEAEQRKVNLSVSVKKGDMVHHQRMLSQDVNAQATQHIIGVPVNKSRYNGYNGEQVTNAKLKQMRPNPDAVRIIPIGGVGEFGIGKNMTIIEYKSEMIVVDMGVLFAGEDYPGGII